jgi:hypothetical protein
MGPYLPDVSQGERPSADWTNELKDIACRDLGMGAAMSDSSGVVPMPPVQPTRLDIYELIADPALDSTWNEYAAAAKPVRIKVTSGVKRYERDDTAPTVYVGFVAQPRDSEGNPTAPTAASGDRVYTYVRWGNREVIVSAPSAVRFFTGTTTSAVSTTDATFTVSGLTAVDGGSVPEPDSGENWTVTNDAYEIDSGASGKIIGYADGTLHPLDFPCPA